MTPDELRAHRAIAFARAYVPGDGVSMDTSQPGQIGHPFVRLRLGANMATIALETTEAHEILFGLLQWENRLRAGARKSERQALPVLGVVRG